MRKLILFLLICISAKVNAQVYQEMPQYGYRANRMAFDSTLQIPTTCGVPTLRSNVTKKSAIAFDSCNNKLYRYNPKTFTWSEVSGGTGTTPNLQQVITQGASAYNNVIYLYDTSYPLYPSKIVFDFNRYAQENYMQIIRDDGTYTGVYGNEKARLDFQDYGLGLTRSISIGRHKTGSSYDNFMSLEFASSGNTQKHKIKSASTFLVDSFTTIIPARRGYLAMSVNNQTADGNGNITISSGGDDTTKVVIAQVYNATGTTLLKGEAVYLFGANGSVASVKRANNKTDATSSKTFGLVRADIPSNSTGYVTTQGQIEKLNLGSYAEGDVLWLDSIDGGLTKVKPQAPYHGVFLGIVERANNGNGLAYIKPQNGVELDEVHDVELNSILNNQIIVYSDTQKVWKNRSIYSLVDTASKIATKTNLTNYVDLTTNQTIAGTKTFSSAIKIPNSGSQLILQVNSDQTVTGMPTSIYPSPSELAYVKGVTSAIQTQVNNKVNISDTATMLSKYLRKTDTITLSNRIENKQTNLDLLQTIGYGIKAEPFGVTLKDATSQLQLTAGRVYFYPFNWNVSDSIRGVAWFNRAASTTNQNGYNGFGIYSLSGSTLTRMVFTTNDSTFWDCASNTWSTKTIPTTFLSKGVYFLAYQISSVTSVGTLPTIIAGDNMVIGESAGNSPQSPPSVVNPNGVKLSCNLVNATTSLPSSVAMNTTAGVLSVPYFMFY